MDPYFRELYGSRWPTLKSALKEEVRHIALVNPFCRTSEHERRRQLGEATANVMGLQVHSRAEPKDGSGGTYPVPPSDQAGVKAWYWMDLASLLPPLALRIGETDAVLDVCAAPGGKSIVMAQRLFRRHRVGSGAEGQAAGGCLVCNEMSASRRKRLNGVVSDYLPADVRSRVRLTGCDGTKLREHGVYDKVLVDAPCSSERHILMQKGPSRDHRSSRSKASPPVIDRWSPKQCKSFAKTQYAILKSALQCLKPGGRLVYSTCSVAVVENDFVVEKVLEKFGDPEGKIAVRVAEDRGFPDPKDRETLEQLGCERTNHGYCMLPDRSKFGPIYWCVLERVKGGRAVGAEDGTKAAGAMSATIN